VNCELWICNLNISIRDNFNVIEVVVLYYVYYVDRGTYNKVYGYLIHEKKNIHFLFHYSIMAQPTIIILTLNIQEQE